MEKDNTIDISKITPAEYRAHITALSNRCTCPCLECGKNCYSGKAECNRYQEWLETTEIGTIAKRMRKRRRGR